MDDFFDRFGQGMDPFGNPSSQDSFDLAALRYFEELDRQAGKDPLPAPPPEPAPAPSPRESAPPTSDGAVMPDLTDSGLDSVVLSLMSEPTKKAPPPRRRTQPLTRPIPRKKQAAQAAEPSAGKDAPVSASSLSDLALQAARLFDSLPTEDQLLAYTLLQKLAKADGEKGLGT